MRLQQAHDLACDLQFGVTVSHLYCGGLKITDGCETHSMSHQWIYGSTHHSLHTAILHTHTPDGAALTVCNIHTAPCVCLIRGVSN